MLPPPAHLVASPSCTGPIPGGRGMQSLVSLKAFLTKDILGRHRNMRQHGSLIKGELPCAE